MKSAIVYTYLLLIVCSPSSSQDSGQQQRMIVPVDGQWLSVMMGKRFLSSSNSSEDESIRSTPSPVDLNLTTLSQNVHNLANYSFNKHLDMFGSQPDGDREASPYSFKEDVKIEKAVSPPVKRKELKFYEMDFQGGGGFVKKSVPFPKASLNKRKNLLNSLKQRCKRKDIQPMDLLREESFNKSTKMLRNRFTKHQEKIQQKLRTHSSRGTNTPPVEDESVFTLLDNRSVSKDSSSNSYEVSMKNHEVSLPPTPPTSVSAPPTPPATAAPSSSSSSNDVPPDFQVSQSNKSKQRDEYDSDRDADDFVKISKIRELAKAAVEKTPVKNVKEVTSFSGAFTNGHNSNIAAINLEISKLSTKNIIEHSKIMSLHHRNDSYSLFHNEHDSSGDDTSSRGTLDSIIPPPANFQGKNNPFHLHANTKSSKGSFSITNKLFNRHSLSKMNSATASTTKNQRISLPASLNPVIIPAMKPLKRQLSEKDLVIGPNGEIKRKKNRKPRKAGQVNHIFFIRCHLLNM